MSYLKKFFQEVTWHLLKGHIKYILSIFLLSFCFSSTSVWAGVIFEFDPFLTSEERYDNNLFLTRSNIKSDWITTISPGFTALLLRHQLNFKLEYQPSFVYFLNNPQFDYIGHKFNFNATIEFTPRLTLSLYENFIRSNEPYLSELLATDYERSLRRTTRTEYDNNIISPRLVYRFGRENVIRLYYRNSSFSDGGLNDYIENYFENEMEYWFNIKNGINLTSHYIKGDFDQDTDLLYSVDIAARYLHRFTSHFKLYGEYGVGVTNFEERRFFERLSDGREFQVGAEDVEDYDLHKFNVGFEWLLPRNLLIKGSIGYFWQQGVSNRDDQGVNSLIEIEKSTRNLAVNLQWKSGYSASYFAVRDAGFIEFWKLSSNLTYSYNERLEFKCHGSYGFDDYSLGREAAGSALEKREDYRYTANILLAYHIVRNYFFLDDLSLEMEFNHIELDSSSDTNSYINNQLMLRITATF